MFWPPCVIKNFFYNKLSILLGSTHHDSPLSTLKVKEPNFHGGKIDKSDQKIRSENQIRNKRI
jgi:hypothetical protein